MPNEWEKRYELNYLDASNSLEDNDKDRYTNIEEYQNGTNPLEFIDYTKAENNVNTLN